MDRWWPEEFSVSAQSSRAKRYRSCIRDPREKGLLLWHGTDCEDCGTTDVIVISSCESQLLRARPGVRHAFAFLLQFLFFWWCAGPARGLLPGVGNRTGGSNTALVGPKI